MTKLYPSSFSFSRNGLVETRYNSGCLRSIYLKANGIKDSSFDPRHKARGDHDELRFEQTLKDSGRAYQREVPLKYSIPDTDFVISGRCDFLLPFERLVIEKKSSDSPSVLTMMNKGQLKPENLCQLVLYLLITGYDTGELIYTHYKVDAKTKVYKFNSEKVYVVTVTGNGKIQVNGKFSGYSVDDLVQHLLAQVHTLRTGEIGPRPANWDQKWGSPCSMCPFNHSCDSYDAGLIDTAEEFVNLTRRLQ